MKTRSIFLGLTLGAAALVTACSTTPQKNDALESARSDYMSAQSDPNVAKFASGELQQANEALDKANNAWATKQSLSTVDNLAYVARQKTATAREITKEKMAEDSVANANRQQDQIRLEQRTVEANRAKLDADAAKNQAIAAQMSADQAQQQKMMTDDKNRQLESQLADLQAKQTERGLVITLGDVLFGVDKAQLTPNGMATVQKLGTILQQNPQRTVLIEGHTDSTGTASYNLTLSDRRANAVVAALMAMGIGHDRVSAHGYGMDYPIASNGNAEGRQLNRRVEIVLSDNVGHVVSR